MFAQTIYIIMDKNQTIEEVLNLSENKVKKIKMSPITALLLISLGVIFIVTLSVLNEGMPGFMLPLLIMLASIFIIWGILSFVFRKTVYASIENGQVIKITDVCFNQKERDKLVRMVETSDFKNFGSLEKSAQDALKLRIASTASGNLCYVQVVVYIPYEFVNATEVKEITNQDAVIALKHI